MPFTAAAIAGSAVLGAGASLYGSSQASKAAKDAANVSRQQYAQTRQDLQPYFQPGYNALSDAYRLTQSGPTGGGVDFLGQAYSNLPMQMTQEQLEKTPGYQFTRDQGLKSVQSSAAARGLGMSGASLKGAADYATGMADKTYLDQFKVSQQRFDDILNLNTGQQANLQGQFGRLNSVASFGEAAATGLGTQGAALTGQQANYISNAGLDQAAGLRNATNALSSGVNNYLGYNQYRNDVTTGGYPTAGTPLQSGQNNWDLLPPGGFNPAGSQLGSYTGYF